MPSETEDNLRFEIGHVLFLDVVGYSELLLDEQREQMRWLTDIVLATGPVLEATNERLVRLPTGDGMALVFRNNLEEPALCALEIARALHAHPEIQVRMGIHSGPVSEVSDLNERTNIAGVGINLAQRVMDCGDAGHILVSQRVAEDLAQYRQWAPFLHELGECEVKHGLKLSLTNLFGDDFGNAAVPKKLAARTGRQAEGTSGPGPGFENFFSELRRRNVYRAGVIYAMASWLLIQIATQVFPFFEIPNWIVRLVILLLIIGFPVALTLAWAFELTPEGIMRTDDVPLGKSIRWTTGRKLDLVIIGILTVAIAFLLYLRFSPSHRRDRAAEIPRKSIAVMPFENLSSDKENSYFTEGIQDEILTRLAKIADLKVISQTSTQQYKSAPENLREIARQLGVAHILEGSVQKSGDKVHINVQLIKAADDSHLWADTYDRKLIDIFSVESEVAKKIADQLQAKITGQEERVIVARSTENPQAYDAYLRGLTYNLRTANSSANSRGAQKYLREAVRLDPKFTLAWTLLSFVDARGYLTLTLQPTAALREEARQAADTALALDPGLGEALHAKGYYYYACLKDYETAVRYFEQARQLLPNSSRIPESLAYVTRRQGQWDRSETYFKEAERLDPRNVYVLGQHAQSLMALRHFPEATQKFDEILNITPGDIDIIASKGAVAQAQGDLPRAAALLAPLRPVPDDSNVLYTQVYQAILERNPAPVIPRLQEILAKPDPTWGYNYGERRFWLGWAQDVAGDHAAALETWRIARADLEPFLKEQPNNYNLLFDLALTQMGLGDKDAALAFSERAMAAMPIAKDAFDGPAPIEILARVAAQVGEPDRAIAALEKVMAVPYEGPLGGGQAPLTPALLRLDPMFDPLRKDPRFEKLAAAPASP